MKRYIGNTGAVHIMEDNTGTRSRASRSDRNTVISDEPSSSLLGNLLGTQRNGLRQSNLPFGLEAGDMAIIALLFFLYRESGDEEFLIILAFFVFSILNK